jgi:ribonuclease HII
VRDSKQLSRAEREQADVRIRAWAVAFAVGHASHEECDELGMTAALRLAGRRALADLATQGYEPDRIILDGNHDYLALGDRVTTVVKGDTFILSVAAASCVAKVTRDALMRREAEHFPPYDFDSNVGYPSPRHQTALRGYGPSTIHRRSWVFMEGLSWRNLPPPPGRLFT